jgi:hypothetical protein
MCCSRACAAALRGSRRQPTPCSICGADTGARLRRTCSDVCCAEASKRRHDAVRGRSSARAQKRSAAKRTAYRRKDKRALEASLYVQQGGLCDICGGAGTELGDGRTGLVLDHCHTTGDARALLCMRCNAAVGLVRERYDIACALANYVRVCEMYANQR